MKEKGDVKIRRNDLLNVSDLFYRNPIGKEILQTLNIGEKVDRRHWRGKENDKKRERERKKEREKRRNQDFQGQQV